jgi:hypothetical protein
MKFGIVAIPAAMVRSSIQRDSNPTGNSYPASILKNGSS